MPLGCPQEHLRLHPLLLPRHCNTYSDGESNGNSNCNRYSDGHVNSDSNGHADSYSYVNAYCNGTA